MDFVDRIARKVTVLHEGTRARRGPMAQVQNDPARRSRSIWGADRCSNDADRRLNQYYGGSHILRDVQLSSSGGARCTALLGRNGVGKTTLLKCLMGVLPIRTGQGRLRRAGHHRTAAASSCARRASATCRRAARSSTALTVEENLRMGLAPAAHRLRERFRSASFEMFPVLKQMLDRRGGDLSGGQQQQLAIGARARR